MIIMYRKTPFEKRYQQRIVTQYHGFQNILYSRNNNVVVIMNRIIIDCYSAIFML